MTKPPFGVILAERPQKGAAAEGRAAKTFPEIGKVFIDKRPSVCYIIQAAPYEGAAGCTLKIEQCKNSLCKNKHQRKGFFKESRNVLQTISFESWKADQEIRF